jgi:broad specificity phosphatase PhoE
MGGIISSSKKPAPEVVEAAAPEPEPAQPLPQSAAATDEAAAATTTLPPPIDASTTPALLRRAELGEVLNRGGITKVVLIRHANAQPRDPEAAAVEAGGICREGFPFANAWTVGDLIRGITEKGKKQAADAKSSWFDAHKLRAVICSEAVRATATKDIMAAGSDEIFAKGGQGMLTLHTLHPSRSGTPDCEKMFGKLGYGTLNTYYADTSVEGCEGKGREIFRGFMDKVTGELHELISAGIEGFPDTGDTVAVFGHAVFLNAVAVAVAEAMDIEGADETIAEMDLGEAEGIMCDNAGAGKVELCSVTEDASA